MPDDEDANKDASERYKDNKDKKSAFVLKVFSHWLPDEMEE